MVTVCFEHRAGVQYANCRSLTSVRAEARPPISNRTSQLRVVHGDREHGWDGLSSRPPSLAFSARLCRDGGDQLLHAGALARWTRDLAAVVFAHAEIQLRLLAAIQAFIFIVWHRMTLLFGPPDSSADSTPCEPPG